MVLTAYLCLHFTPNELFHRIVNNPVHNPRDISSNPYPAWTGIACCFCKQLETNSNQNIPADLFFSTGLAVSKWAG